MKKKYVNSINIENEIAKKRLICAWHSYMNKGQTHKVKQTKC